MGRNFLVFARLATGLALALPVAGSAVHATPAASHIAADHHMHIASPAAAQRDATMCARIGKGACGDMPPLEPSTGTDAIRALDEAGIGRGVLLSMAYMAGAPKLGESERDIATDTRAENSYVVREAAASCGRLVAFISVNPNSANALDEIGYWARHGGAAGLKLHLANSGFDFSSPQQVKRLAAVFEAAGAAHLSIIIHMRNTDSRYGAAQVRIFLRDILPAAHGTVVQIAHSAGWGGADRPALSALGAFADAIRRDPKGTANLYFDMAVMPDVPGTSAAPRAAARYVQLMRQIGLNRFLPASDWVKGTDLNAYYGSVRHQLKLTDAEWAGLSRNIAPYLLAADQSPHCPARDPA